MINNKEEISKSFASPTKNEDAETELKLKWINRMSKLMDEQFSIGGYKFGIDPLLNFIPYAGDIATYIMSLILVITMMRHGVSGKVAIKMIGNVTADALLGAIPVLGWIFDFGFKANKKNVKLLREHYVTGKNKGSAKPYIIAVIIVLLIVMIFVFWLSFRLLQWIFDGLNQMQL